MKAVRRFVRDCGLSLFFGLIFLLALAGQAVAGWKAFNAEQSADQLARLSLPEYLTSASFAGDVAENWQSEYLQFLLYIVITVCCCSADLLSPRRCTRPAGSRTGNRRSASTPSRTRPGGLASVECAPPSTHIRSRS